jgi:hypothetical protein
MQVSSKEQWFPQRPQLLVSLMNEASLMQLPMHIE